MIRSSYKLETFVKRPKPPSFSGGAYVDIPAKFSSSSPRQFCKVFISQTLLTPKAARGSVTQVMIGNMKCAGKKALIALISSVFACILQRMYRRNLHKLQAPPPKIPEAQFLEIYKDDYDYEIRRGIPQRRFIVMIEVISLSLEDGEFLERILEQEDAEKRILNKVRQGTHKFPKRSERVATRAVITGCLKMCFFQTACHKVQLWRLLEMLLSDNKKRMM